MKSKLLTLLIAATLSTAALIPSVALADIYVGSWSGSTPGSRVDAYEDDKGKNWFIETSADGTILISYGLDGNPNPDGPNTGPISAAEVQNLLKKVKNAYAPKKNAEQTVIGKYINRAGKGFGIEERVEQGGNPKEKLWKCEKCGEATWSEEKPSPHEEPVYDKFGESLEDEPDEDES